MDFATIFREVLALWQGPSYTELSLEDLLAAGNRSVRKALIDLDLTPDAAFLAVNSVAFMFNSSEDREKDLSMLSDLSRPFRVESRGLDSTSDDDWEEERIASFENWNDIMERGDGNYVAFRGTPPALTMIVNRDASDLEFRVVYSQQAVEVTGTSDSIALPPLFKPYLVYDIALEVGELIDNQSPEFLRKKDSKMLYLASRKKEAHDQLNKWRRAQKGTSVTTRRAFNDRQAVPGIGLRRFTVRW